jgi:nucleotide-binding universal stress UspA family protein
METIVVGYDDEPPARRALGQAIERAHASGGKVVVVVVAEMPLQPGLQNYGTLDDSPPPPFPVEPPPAEQAMLDAAREQIEAAHVEAEYVWVPGDPAQTIIAVAKEKHASLVVLGHHHHSWLGRVFGGDTADAVSHALDTETLVVD